MTVRKRKNQEFKIFTLGIIFSLSVALVLFLITLFVLNSAPDAPSLLNFKRWSGVSDVVNLVIGLPIAFAGAYVAISIASRAADLSEKQQSQQDHAYYEQLHEQLIDNYYEIARSSNQLISAANRFEESFYARFKGETDSKYSVINFVDDDHRRTYIQDMLVQNRNGITAALSKIHDDIKQDINDLLASIDSAFKHSSVNETWQISTSAPNYQSLLNSACERGLFTGSFHQHRTGLEWLIDAKSEIMERLDLHQVNDAASDDQGHPLLPFCLYLSELNDYQGSTSAKHMAWNAEVLLAGYFLMTHVQHKESGEKIFFNSGALFLVDLINSLPTSEHIKLAFSRRYIMTESAYEGKAYDDNHDVFYQSAEEAYSQLDTNSQHLFLLLSQNIQFDHYSTRIRKARPMISKVIEDHGQADDALSLLRISYEPLHSAEMDMK